MKLHLLKLFMAGIMLALSYSSAHAEGTWLYYSGDEITGTVVDADTKEPIEGVIVIAQWRLTEVPGEGFGGFAHIGDAVTAKDGSFTIPSWWSFRPWKLISIVRHLEPKIIIYKPGYRSIWTHKLSRAGYPDRMDLTKEEKMKIKEESSLNPAKLKRVKTDEEIWESYKEFRSDAHFPDVYYTAKQIKTILNVLEIEMTALPIKDDTNKSTILKNIKESYEYWHGGSK